MNKIELEYRGGNTNVVFPENGNYRVQYNKEGNLWDGFDFIGKKKDFMSLSKAWKFYKSLNCVKSLYNEDHFELVSSHTIKKTE